MAENLCSPGAISLLLVALILCLTGWYGMLVSRGWRVLVCAVAQGETEAFRRATQRYGGMLRKDGNLACSVLELLIGHNRVDFLPVLLQYQSPEKLQTYRVEHMDPSLLRSVVTDGTPEMLEALLMAGFDPMRDVESLWMLCCEHCRVAHARVLAKYGADYLSAVHREMLQAGGGYISSLHAVVAGAMSKPLAALEMTRYLVCEHGENVNAPEADGRTVLDLLGDEQLCRCDNLEPLRSFLLAQGARYAKELTVV